MEEEQMAEKEKQVPLSEAKRQVEVTSQRLALLHLSFARAIIDELGPFGNHIR